MFSRALVYPLAATGMCGPCTPNAGPRTSPPLSTPHGRLALESHPLTPTFHSLLLHASTHASVASCMSAIALTRTKKDPGSWKRGLGWMRNGGGKSGRRLDCWTRAPPLLTCSMRWSSVASAAGHTDFAERTGPASSTTIATPIKNLPSTHLFTNLPARYNTAMADAALLKHLILVAGAAAVGLFAGRALPKPRRGKKGVRGRLCHGIVMLIPL